MGSTSATTRSFVLRSAGSRGAVDRFAVPERESIDLERFHGGERDVLEQVYKAFFADVERTASRYCRGVDIENVVHDVFYSIVARKSTRRAFLGGDMRAWLVTMTRNRAIDLLRRQRRDVLMREPTSLEGRLEPIDGEALLLDKDHVRALQQAMARFEREELPQLHRGLEEVYRLRFKQGLNQVNAAKRAGLARTTFVSREQKLLKRLGPYLKRSLGEAA